MEHIAILGGTGAEGSGLGYRWALAGYTVTVGSRSAERAEGKAAELTSLLPAGREVYGAGNRAAAAAADIIVLSVPYAAQEPTLADVKEVIEGKLVVSVVVPLKPPKVSRVWLPDAGSAAIEAQQLLGDGTPVVVAFQNVSAEHLFDTDHIVDCDVLICGDKKAHRDVAVQLAQAAGMRGVHAGPLQNAGIVEGLTALLISINIRYKIKNSGIRITGIPE